MLKTVLAFSFFIHLAAISPPNPAAIDNAILHYFDAQGTDLENRINELSLSLNKYEAIGDKKLDATVSKIHLCLKSLAVASSAGDAKPAIAAEFSKNYTLDDLLNINHQIRKKKLDIKSLYEEERENKRGLDAAYDKFDREFKSYHEIAAEKPEKIACGLDTLYNFILLKIGERKQQIFQNTLQKEKAELSTLESELLFAKNNIFVHDQQLLALKDDAELLKKDWLAIKSSHQEKEADLLLDDQEQIVKQEILKSSLKELNAKQKFVHSDIKLTLASALSDTKTAQGSYLNQRISSWELLLTNLHQLIDSWTGKLNKSMQLHSEILSLNVNATDSLAPYALAQENLLSLQTVQSSLEDIEFLLSLLKEQIVLTQGGLAYALNSTVHYITQGVIYLRDALDTTLFHIGLTPITYWGIIRFFAILLFTLYASRFLIRTLSSYALEKKRVSRSIVYRLSRLLHYFVLTVGILLALSSIGFDFSNLLLVAGALGVGLGFGLQSIFNNFISGLIMLFESQFKIGDFIEVAPGVKGEIREINVRSTLLTTTDGVEIIVPNAEFISNRITNWTFRHSYRRVHIPFSVACGSDPKHVQEVILAVAKKMPDTLVKPGFEEPQVVLLKLAESSMDFELVVWVTKFKGATQSDYLIAINQALNDHDIVQPFPQRDVSVTNVLGAKNFDEIKKLFNEKRS